MEEARRAPQCLNASEAERRNGVKQWSEAMAKPWKGDLWLGDGVAHLSGTAECNGGKRGKQGRRCGGRYRGPDSGDRKQRKTMPHRASEAQQPHSPQGVQRPCLNLRNQ
jgi:hypothetical protein